jgi:hypothetical protein
VPITLFGSSFIQASATPQKHPASFHRRLPVEIEFDSCGFYEIK